MEKIKVGDKVRQVKVAHVEQTCYLGRVGVVKETRYNHNMAAYGKGDEILVDFDGSGSLWIEYEEYLEKITTKTPTTMTQQKSEVRFSRLREYHEYKMRKSEQPSKPLQQ